MEEFCGRVGKTDLNNRRQVQKRICINSPAKVSGK